MLHSRKLLYNTITIYVKILLNTVFTLIATRIVLSALGADEFGLYNLIAGVIVLLSFLNGALIISTQRFLSIAIGKGDKEQLCSIFNCGIAIHAFIAFVLVVVLLALQPILLGGFLNIPDGLDLTAHIIYDIMIVSSVITLIVIPYSALINSFEDNYFFAISECVACFLRLLSAIIIQYVASYKLEIYTVLMLFSVGIDALLKYVWCKLKYPVAKLSIRKMRNRQLLHQMFGFVGWNTLGSSAVLVRNQGVAVVLNVFFGTVVNAAYGVANQVNGLIMTLATTITTVFSPSIIQARGAGDNKRMLEIAIFSSKISFLISSLTAIPLLIFMPDILRIWLGSYPEYTVMFCRLIIFPFLLMQIVPGINRMVYAVGNIKYFQIVISIILYSIAPIGYWLFSLNCPVKSIFCVMIVAQVLTVASEIYFAYRCVQFNLKGYLYKSIFMPLLVFGAMFCFFYFLECLFVQERNTFLIIIASLLMIFVYISVYSVLIFDKIERKKVVDILKVK